MPSTTTIIETPFHPPNTMTDPLCPHPQTYYPPTPSMSPLPQIPLPNLVKKTHLIQPTPKITIKRERKQKWAAPTPAPEKALPSRPENTKYPTPAPNRIPVPYIPTAMTHHPLHPQGPGASSSNTTTGSPYPNIQPR